MSVSSKQQAASSKLGQTRSRKPPAPSRQSRAPEVVWTVHAQVSASVIREGFTFAATIQQFAGLWTAIGVVAPAHAHGSPSDIMEQVFAQHGHQFIASTPDLAEAQQRCKEFCLQAPVPTNFCPCPDLAPPVRSAARTRKARS